VKSDGPADLVFQSVRQGKPMRDNNILTRHIKPAARALGLEFVNWRCLRTSYGTWLKRHGADMKDIQGQMRHSRMSHDCRSLRSGHTGVAAQCGGTAALADGSAVTYWNVLERNVILDSLQLVDSMVARDGVEPPPPAFSELG
jgi:hypothetical protein